VVEALRVTQVGNFAAICAYIAWLQLIVWPFWTGVAAPSMP